MNKAAFIKIGFLLTVLLSDSKALAQEQIDDECIRKIDPYYVYFTAFQPEPGAMAQRFCQKLPTVGRVITTVDYEEQALRDMKTEIRIIQVESWSDAFDEEKDTQAKTVVHVPAKTYPQGALTVEHTFTEPGYFVEVLNLESQGQVRHVLRFPFQVGAGGIFWVTVTITLVFFALVGAIVYYFSAQRREIT